MAHLSRYARDTSDVSPEKLFILGLPPKRTIMKLNGARRRLMTLSRDELVPVELHLGSQQVDVWIDHEGIHFRQGDENPTVGHLPWELAIAMSLVPPEWRPLIPEN